MVPLRRTTAALLSAALLAPASAVAQQPGDTASERPRTTEAGKEARQTDLPVSLERIRRELVATTRTTSSSQDPLRLEYFIDVYGRAPRIELFTREENLTSAPVMYGGMTHQEFMQVVTPQEFRAPAGDISGAIAALVKWLSEKNQKSGGEPRK
ncbi:MAG TPA: hypothetical protein VF159_14370 [Gemmatimonadaceae bacterium]